MMMSGRRGMGGANRGSSTGFTRVFDDDFESYSVGTLPTTNWNQDGSRNMGQVVTSCADGKTGAHGGSKLLRCNQDGTVLSNDPAAFENAVMKSFPYTDEIFYRVWWRRDDNLELTTGSPCKLLRIFNPGAPTNTDMYGVMDAAGLDGIRNEGQVGGSGLTTYYGDAVGDTSNTNADWHKWEAWFKTSTGQIRIWQMGVKIRDETGLTFGRPWVPLYLMSNWSDAHDAVNYTYFDDVEVFSDSTSGTPTSGLMSDATISV
jgi:hypothetical protein